MYQIFNKVALFALPALLLFSCSKKDDPVTPIPVEGNGKVKLEFFNNVGGSKLYLSNDTLSQWYTNANGDSFTVTKFNYYVSHIKLMGADSITYTEPESYHLLRQSVPTAMSFDLADVPAATYTKVELMIGVDSLRNVSGAQTGDLDPLNGMFWTWNSGYIMLKFEGTSPKSTQFANSLTLHAGGFKGINAVMRTITLDLPTPIVVNAKNENHVHLTADVQALFKSPTLIDFARLSAMMEPGPDAKRFADNYANMFTITYAGL